jgi:hypothetical protein
LCETCCDRETSGPRRICRSQGCLNNCLSFYTHCRDCFAHSKVKKCFTPQCRNSLTNPIHKFCKTCHVKRSRFHPYGTGVRTATANCTSVSSASSDPTISSSSPTSTWISSFLNRNSPP